MNQNLTQCSHCGLWLISEELSAHICKKGEETYELKGNILRYFDGFRWYRYKLKSTYSQAIRSSNEDLHDNESDEDLTEPTTAKFKKPFRFVITICPKMLRGTKSNG
jgi:hypothetical protein